MKRNETLKKILDKWPGKNVLGFFRFMPLFFLMGAGLEFTMINWDVRGKVNFYRTYKNRQIENLVEERLRNIKDTTL